MSTIPQRVEAIEQELVGIKLLLQQATPAKDWRSTFGMSRDDPEFPEMIRLGREIRDTEQPQEK